MVKTPKKPSPFSDHSDSGNSCFSSQPDSEDEELMVDSEGEDEVIEVSMEEPAPSKKQPARPTKQPAQPERQLFLRQSSSSKKPVNVFLRSFFNIETLSDGRKHITCLHPGCDFKKKVKVFNATICRAHLVNNCAGIDIATRFRLLDSECANHLCISSIVQHLTYRDHYC